MHLVKFTTYTHIATATLHDDDACHVLYHCKNKLVLFFFSPYISTYNISVYTILFPEVRLNLVYLRKQRIKVADTKVQLYMDTTSKFSMKDLKI